MKKGNGFRHLYTAKAADLHEDYLKPQENGSHYDCTMVQAADADVMRQVTGESFSFSASPYTQEELTKKKHNFEREKIDATILCVDKLPDVITLTDDVLPETIPGDAPVVLMAK